MITARGRATATAHTGGISVQREVHRDLVVVAGTAPRGGEPPRFVAALVNLGPQRSAKHPRPADQSHGPEVLLPRNAVHHVARDCDDAVDGDFEAGLLGNLSDDGCRGVLAVLGPAALGRAESAADRGSIRRAGLPFELAKVRQRLPARLPPTTLAR